MSVMLTKLNDTEIREQFVSPETALLLKKKGFDEACRHYYDTVPTQALVMRWLREKHNLFIDISLINDESEDADGKVIEEWHFWSYSIIRTLDGRYLYDAPDQFDCVEYQTYEEACEDAIKYTLNKFI